MLVWVPLLRLWGECRGKNGLGLCGCGMHTCSSVVATALVQSLLAVLALVLVLVLVTLPAAVAAVRQRGVARRALPSAQAGAATTTIYLRV